MIQTNTSYGIYTPYLCTWKRLLGYQKSEATLGLTEICKQL